MSKTLPDPPSVAESAAVSSAKVEYVFFAVAYCGLHNSYVI